MARSATMRAPSLPEITAPSIRADPHLYESFKKIEAFMQQASALLAVFAFPDDATVYLDGTGHFTAPDVDGGSP